MKLLEAQARECYTETVDMGSAEFVMMLLLDGSFILELLLKFQTGKWDPCLVSWVVGDIVSDLCLLENQMPFFVIHKLLASTQGRCPKSQGLCPLLELINAAKPLPEMLFQFRLPQISCSKIHHLLDLYYKGVLPDIQVGMEQRDLDRLQIFRFFNFFSKSSNNVSENAKSRDVKSMTSNQINIPCITELHAAGVKFRRKMRPRDMFDISFQNGTMEMPKLLMDSYVKNFLWNMVAFEQNQPCGYKGILSSYFGLMDSLINTAKDVAILEQSGIIENFLQNDEQAATFFNQFAEIFVLDYSDHYFHGLYKDVKRCSESTWHKYRARLMQDYFSNPWSAISVVAASILLILTFLQTYFSAAK